MRTLLNLRKTASRGALVLALAAFACAAVRADTEVQTQTLTPSGSSDNVTNGDVITVFSDAVTFDQFNSSLGTLTGATLAWSATGSLTVGGNLQGEATMAYGASFDNETWNIQGGTTTVDFSISSPGPEILNVAGLTGTGTLNEGNFVETFQNQGGYFPDSFSTGTTSGSFVLTYDYTPLAPPPPAPAVPELPSFAYLFTALLLVTPGLHRLAKNSL